MPVNIEIASNPFSAENLEATLKEEEIPEGTVATTEEPTEQEGTEAKTEATSETEVPDADAETEPSEEEENKLLAGKFKTQAELEASYKSLELLQARQATELGELRKTAGQSQTPAKTPEEQSAESNTPVPPVKNYGVILGKDAREQEQQILSFAYGKHEKTGLPLDQYGVVFVPDTFWKTTRVKEYVEAGYDLNDPEDVTVINAEIANERLEWQRRYITDHNIAKSNYDRYENTIKQTQTVKVKEQLARQAEEVPKVRTRIIEQFVKAVPESAAIAIADRLLAEASAWVTEDLQKGLLTDEQASHPDMPNYAVGQLIAKKYQNGELGELLMSVMGRSDMPVGNVTAGSAGSSAAGGRGAGNGTSAKAAATKYEITAEDIALAKVYKTTPEEQARMRNEED